MTMQSEKEILIIDDNEFLLSQLKALLERDGFRALTCPDPASALVLAREWDFDIFVVDYRFPNATGDSLTAAIRKMHPSAMIIGCSLESKEKEFLSAGADRFISKEDLPSKLSVLVRNR
jgi:DNA-binding response OmpR family regulator